MHNPIIEKKDSSRGLKLITLEDLCFPDIEDVRLKDRNVCKM